MVKLDNSMSCLCLGVAIVLGLRILKGIVDGIIITTVLCDTNVGFLYKDSQAGFQGMNHNYGMLHISVYQRRI